MFPGKARLPGNNGVALLLVVSVVSLLTVIILQFNKNMRLNLEQTWSFKGREQLYSMAASGIDLAVAVLQTDNLGNDYDSLHDFWARIGDEPLEIFDGRARLSITITDLSGRFPLNSMVNSAAQGSTQGATTGLTPELAREIFRRLLLSGDFAVEDDLQANEIVDSIIDWLDSDDNESTYGVEDGYYESLDPAYTPRNDFMELPNEPAAVKGVTPELLYGNDEKKALADYINVMGVGKTINMNTADPLVLQSLDERIDAEMAALLVEYRGDENNVAALSEPTWYRGVSGWPGDIEIGGSVLSTTSSYFMIRAEATLDNEALTMSAYVQRSGKQKMEVLYRRIN